MTTFGAIMDLVMAHVTASVTGVTTETRYRNFDDIGELPFAMAYAREADRDVQIHQQLAESGVFRIALVVNDTADDPDHEQLADSYRELIDAALNADPTLGGAVNQAWIASWAVAPEIDTARATAILTVAFERDLT